MNIREKLNRIFELSLELTPDKNNNSGGFGNIMCYITFRPNISWVLVKIYLKGFRENTPPNKRFGIYIEDNTEEYTKADECIAYLEALLDKEELS